MTYHIKLKFKGSGKRIEFFNALMRSLDSEFPYPPSAKATKCEKCKGYAWPNPMFGPKHLSALAEQIGLNDLKIHKFWGEKACHESTDTPLIVVATAGGDTTSPIQQTISSLEEEVRAIRDVYGEAWGDMT